ncbi:hypothetical protein BGI42_15410 (plasmid) [Clostridium taeniosporum]|uniref:Uncharacterized protein n=1 Tax=Clostridium taeniosporum TaxID=394958 RepID=A0A1D7XP72_9CLOT|nr:hypothetical protein BGI42_15410 [Clostridium taeniosporum]
MFNYNKLINIYNSLEKSNMVGSYYLYDYINSLTNRFNIILSFLILVINSKNKIYKNIIYVNGTEYTYNNIKDFTWSEKKIW